MNTEHDANEPKPGRPLTQGVPFEDGERWGSDVVEDAARDFLASPEMRAWLGGDR